MSQLFTYKSHQVRTFTENGELWFAATDVCKALTIPWRGKTLTSIPETWKRSMRNFRMEGFVPRNLIFISEPAVYKLAFRSNKPEADAFTNWVASEVLPSIRKSGKYEGKANPVQTELPPAPETSRQPGHLPTAFALNLSEPAPGDRYHAYLEEVEKWRKAAVAERDRLYSEGISLIDADRVGRLFFHACADFLSEWLDHTVLSKTSVFDEFLKMQRAPVVLIKYLNQSFESVNAYLR